MTPQELKNSILQLAIQGKLVDQRPEEGTGKELLEKILRDRAAETTKQTRTTGKAKVKSRVASRASSVSSVSSVPVVPPIPDDEKPFDIPESWEWVRLGEVVSNHGQKKPTGDFSYIDIGSIDNKNQRLSNDETIVNAENASPRARKIVQIGDVIYATVRPYLHNVCVIDREFSREPIASTGFAVMACADCLYNKYLFYFLLSPDFERYANSSENAKGVAYPAISDKRLYNAIIPLPPLAEQKRIVAKIEELLPLIDRYEKAWSKLEDFNKRFPVDMQKSLLQMAIQGKLVDHRLEEGTGKELLEKILRNRAAETTKQTRTTGKAKVKSRVASRASSVSSVSSVPVVPPIPDDEKPFDIPESWEWVRLGDLGSLKSGYAFKSTEYTKDGIQVVRISDLSDDSIGLKDAVFYPRKPELSQYLVVDGSFLICMTGSIGKMAWVKDSVLRYLNQRVGMFIPNALCSSTYLWFFLHTFYVIDKWISAKTSTNGNIKNSDIVELLIPLPPLAEQKRIVAKLEEILPLCERLK